MSVIKLDRINKYYGNDECSQQVLDNVSLQIEEGEMVSIMGPSGSGKSTLLNILGLLDNQSDGEYYLDDISTLNLSEKELAFLRNSKIGFVFQSFNLIKELTALENVQMSLIFSNMYRKNNDKFKKNEIRNKSMELLELVGLKEHKGKKPSQLSGGQQQRVAIARALVNEPKIILADEPTGALDQKNSKEIMNILLELNKKGKTIIIVTHDSNVASLCQRHFSMTDGKII